MSASDVLAAGRAAAEALMVDSCTVRRRTGESVDEDTAAVTPVYTVVVAGQSCKVQTRGNWGESRDVGESALVVLPLEVHFPISVVGLEVRDEVTIDTCVHDPDLVGRVLRIKDLHHKSFATARRVMCQEVTG